MSIKPIGLCQEGITTVTTGPAILIRGERIETGNAKNYQRRNIPITVQLIASGSSGNTWSAKIETSPDNSSWTQWGSTFTGTIPSTNAPVTMGLTPLVGVIPSTADYVRVNVTAISSATVQGWIKRMD